MALDPDDLCQTGPAGMIDHLDRRSDAAGLDAAMALFDGLSLAQIRRRDGRLTPQAATAGPSGIPR